MTLAPSVRKTSSKPEVNFVSRSRMRNLADRERSVRSRLRLRACWMTHSPAGLAVTPYRWTCRVSSSMKEEDVETAEQHRVDREEVAG